MNLPPPGSSFFVQIHRENLSYFHLLVSYWHCIHHWFPTHVYGAAHVPVPAQSSPPHWPHWGMVPPVGVEPDFVVVVTGVKVVVGGRPRLLATWFKKPGFCHTRLASHIMTPAKVSNPLPYWMMGASPAASTYDPAFAAPGPPGTPIISFTFLLSEAVFAQLCQTG